MKSIKLTRGKVALVDDEDYEYLSQWKWHAQKSGNSWYAARTFREGGRKFTRQMHKLIVPFDLVDHADGDGLNNQKHNLRECSRQLNMANSKKQTGSSQFKGVCYYKRTGKWKASIMVNGKHLHLGYFDSEVLASLAYRRAAATHFGDFTCHTR